MKMAGLTGPKGSGKTSLYRAMTAGRATGEIAAVPVPDPRVETLAQLHASRKISPVHLTVVDVHAAEPTVAAALARLRGMDALIVVLPAFGGQDAEGALRRVREDLLIADMVPIESRLERARKDPALEAEASLLELALAQLEEGKFLREREWDQRDRQFLSGVRPITLKPLIAVKNVDEAHLGDPTPSSGIVSLAACATLEEEAAALDPGEAREILAGYGIPEPLVERLVSLVFKELDLVTFFVTDQKETRALELRRGSTAFEAAGEVHSDMQRGFIRAEVASFEKVVDAGSWEKAKAAGVVKVEGRDYVVADGDVIRFRFSV